MNKCYSLVFGILQLIPLAILRYSDSVLLATDTLKIYNVLGEDVFSRFLLPYFPVPTWWTGRHQKLPVEYICNVLKRVVLLGAGK
jgi:hypothetical protein